MSNDPLPLLQLRPTGIGVTAGRGRLSVRTRIDFGFVATGASVTIPLENRPRQQRLDPPCRLEMLKPFAKGDHCGVRRAARGHPAAGTNVPVISSRPTVRKVRNRY
jgi:hypothetical protein